MRRFVKTIAKSSATAVSYIEAKSVLNALSTTSNLGSVPAGAENVAETTNPMGQSTVVQFTPPAQNTHYFLTIPLASPTDLRNGQVEFTVRHVSNINNLSAHDIEFHSSTTVGTPTADYSGILGWNDGISLHKAWSTSDGTGAGRWQTIGFNTARVTIAGAGADMSQVRWMRLRIRGASSVPPPVIQFGPIRFQVNPLRKAQLILCFDDGYASAYTAWQNAKTKGFPIVIQPGAAMLEIGAAGKLTIAQLQEMQAAGSQIASQAWSSESIQSQSEVDALKSWMAANGLKGGDFGSYYSALTQRRLDVWPVFRDNFPQGIRTYDTPRAALPAAIFGEQYPFIDRGAVRALAGDNTLSGYRVAHIEQAVSTRGVAVFVWHNDTSGVQEVIDYADAHRNVIEVTTPAALATRFV